MRESCPVYCYSEIQSLFEVVLLYTFYTIGKERRRKVSKEKSQTSCHYMPQKQGEAASPFTP